MNHLYVIYSHEHEAWWGPNHRGYTTDLAKAGRYTAKEAGDIVLDHIPPGEEVAVRADVVAASPIHILEMLRRRQSA